MDKGKQPALPEELNPKVGRVVIPPSSDAASLSPPPSPRLHPEWHHASTFPGTWYEGKPWRPMVPLENDSDHDKIAVYLNSLEKVTSDWAQDIQTQLGALTEAVLIMGRRITELTMRLPRSADLDVPPGFPPQSPAAPVSVKRSLDFEQQPVAEPCAKKPYNPWEPEEKKNQDKDSWTNWP